LLAYYNTGTINGFAVQPANPKTMYVAMRDGVYRSEDAGVRSTPAPGGPKDAVVVAVHPKSRRRANQSTR